MTDPTLEWYEKVQDTRQREDTAFTAKEEKTQTNTGTKQKTKWTSLTGVNVQQTQNIYGQELT